jgi:ribosomal protein S18 acetylase RimI-like enzyme
MMPGILAKPKSDDTVVMKIETLSIDHYDELYAFWRSTEGLGLSGADDRENIARFLERNPGMSIAIFEEGRIIGSVLCGHDGRRGYLYHLAVEKEHRSQGFGELLADKALERLAAAGIEKCHTFVFDSNVGGKQFWRRAGWIERDDLCVFSHAVSRRPD